MSRVKQCHGERKDNPKTAFFLKKGSPKLAATRVGLLALLPNFEKC
jgi:hypothetical protein